MCNDDKILNRLETLCKINRVLLESIASQMPIYSFDSARNLRIRIEEIDKDMEEFVKNEEQLKCKECKSTNIEKIDVKELTHDCVVETWNCLDCSTKMTIDKPTN